MHSALLQASSLPTVLKPNFNKLRKDVQMILVDILNVSPQAPNAPNLICVLKVYEA